MTESSNRYCQRLRIPVPTVESAAARPAVNVFLLMVVTLLEHGSPMTLDQIVARLERTSLPPRLVKGDLRTALKTAWHGRPPIVRDTGDRLALDLLFSNWWHLLLDIGSRPPRFAPPPKPELRVPPDEVPLSREEVDAAFKDRWLWSCSSIRQAAAVLEAAGTPLTVEAINARLHQLSPHTAGIRDDSIPSWRSDLVVVDPAGTLRMNPASAAAPAFRRDIRKMAGPRLRAAAERARFEAQRPDVDQARKAEERQEMEEARATRRALVHIVPGHGLAQAAALIDAQARSVRVLMGEDLRELGSILESFDLLAGLDLRPSLRALGLDPERWLLAEMRPTDRTHRPTDRAPVRATLDGIVRATTGARRAPAGPDEWQRLLGTGRREAVEKRLASDAQTLFALYEYGVLHGGLRLRARMGDRLLPVSWAMPGDADVHSILDVAVRTWTPLDAVIGSPVEQASRLLSEGLADPWSRAVRVDVVERDWPRLIVRTADGLVELDAHSLFALRLATPSAAAAVRPRRSFSFDQRVCQLKVTIEGIEPPIWRRLVVPVWMTLERVHAVLQTALGWTDSHLHVFEIDGERIGVPYEMQDLVEVYTRSGRLVHLLDLVQRGCRRFVYEYDFGDSWRHLVEVEDVREPGDEGGARCLDGARACPPEDCGGVGGYQRLLEILFDPAHEEFEELRTWVGPDFQPERFDLRAVNDRLARLR